MNEYKLNFIKDILGKLKLNSSSARITSTATDLNENFSNDRSYKFK